MDNKYTIIQMIKISARDNINESNWYVLILVLIIIFQVMDFHLHFLVKKTWPIDVKLLTPEGTDVKNRSQEQNQGHSSSKTPAFAIIPCLS